MKLSKRFWPRLRQQHADEISAVELPEGTGAYIAERIACSDAETLTFMLKLAYLMGLHAGYAAQQEEPSDVPDGSLQA